MRDFHSILSGFHQATETLSFERFETASIILPIFQSLKDWLAVDNLEGPKVTTNDGKLLRSALSKSYNFYMEKYGYFENPLLKAITFLDPRLINYLN